MNILNVLNERLGKDRVRENKDLAPYLTLRTQTKADFFFEARSREDIIKSYQVARELSLPFFLLGGGTNLAVISTHIEGLVVRNQYLSFAYVEKKSSSALLRVSSGYPMSLVVKRTIDDGYEGFEYQMGLPGTIGGGVFMNSKWTKPLAYIGDHLEKAELLSIDGTLKTVSRDYFTFAYDTSILQKTNEILLEAWFRLNACPVETLKKRSLEALEYRKLTQPFGVKSSGCFFRNISQTDRNKHHLPTTSAGYLIDHAGLKGKRIGGFVVSDKHANFILNDGSGDPKDLVKLLDVIKETVEQKFGVALSPEVLIV